jgi:hypothetical protein
VRAAYSAARVFPPRERNSAFTRVSRCLSELREGVMKRIIQANIDRFKLMLDTETDTAKRAMLFRLLAEQEAELKAAPEAVAGVPKAY